MTRLVGCANECEIFIEGLCCSSLIDTGSMITTLSQSFYSKHLSHIPLHSIDGLIDVKVAGGSSLPYSGYIEVKIAFPEFENSVDCLVLIVDDTDYNSRVPLLIGTNLISTCYELYKGTNNCMSLALGRPWLLAFQWLMGGNSGDGQIYCSHIDVESQFHSSGKLVVPGYTKMIVPGKARVNFSANKVVMSSECSDKLLPGGIILTPSISYVGPDTLTIPVQLENVSNKPITIPSDVPLCMLQDVFVVGCMPQDAEQHQAREFLSMFDLNELSGNLSADEIQRLNSLLYKWENVFSVGEWDLGRTDLISHRINMTDDQPLKQRHRRIPPAMYDEVRQHLKDMLNAGLIRDSYSPWASPLVLVRKKDNSLRLCIDFRLVNKKTIRDSYYLPRIDESMNALAGAKLFSVLDLKSGFWQVEVAEEHRERTAFTAGPLGLYECNVLPFGVTNGPATFQRLMEKAMGDLQPEKCLIYLDDIIVHSSTVSEGLDRLECVFSRLARAKLKLKPSKCKFFQTKVSYLGHIVSEAGIEVDPEKTAALEQWPVPQNVSQVRRFLGFAGFYRRYMKDFSRIAKPLHDLLIGSQNFKWKGRKKKSRLVASWKWGEEQQTAFDKIRKFLTEAPILGYADYRLPFEVHTDASTTGLGAVLYQVQDGVQRVIAYASRSLKPSERRYPAHKLEFLALKWAVTEKFHEYLYGTHFEVKTDNNPLTYVLTSAKLDATGHRWLASLSSYNFSISYKAGKTNIDADALSRISDPDDPRMDRNLSGDGVNALCQSHLLDIPLIETFCLQEGIPVELPNTQVKKGVDIMRLQCNDNVIRQVMEYVKRGQRPRYLGRFPDPEMRALLAKFSSLQVIDSILYRIAYIDGKSSPQVVLPASCREEVMFILHDDMGHVGRDRTLDLVRSRFYWPGMTKDVEAKVTSCMRCLQRKAGVPLPRAPLVNIQTSQPMELVCLDFLSIEPSKGYGNILVITDHFSRYAQAIPTRNQTAQTTAKVFYENFVVHYGIPARIHSDQGRNFESQLLKQLCLILGTEKSRTTPYHPQGNGMCERFNRTLLNMLGTLPSDRKSCWKDSIGTIVHAYNCTKHDSTGFTPFELMFGRPPRLPVDLIYGTAQTNDELSSYSKYIADLRNRLGRAFQLASRQSESSMIKQKEYYDKRIRGAMLHPGDLVLVRKTGVHAWDKLTDRWEEVPHEVKKKLCDDIPVYVVQSIKGGRKRTLHRNLLLPIRAKKLEHEASTHVTRDVPHAAIDRAADDHEKGVCDTESSVEESVGDSGALEIGIEPAQSLLDHQPALQTESHDSLPDSSARLCGTLSDTDEAADGSLVVGAGYDAGRPDGDVGNALDVGDAQEANELPDEQSESEGNQIVQHRDSAADRIDTIVGIQDHNLSHDVVDDSCTGTGNSVDTDVSENSTNVDQHVAPRRSTRKRCQPQRYGWQMQIVVSDTENIGSRVASCPVILVQPRSILASVNS